MAKNLLTIQGLGPLLLSRWSWRLVRLLLLALLFAMIGYGWHQHAIPGVRVADPLMYTNLATYGFWVLWLMGAVFLALFLGRAWCAVCPVGWLNGLVARVGLKRPLPAALRNFVPVTLTLLGLQLGVYFLAIHRFPDLTAGLLALMVLLAVAAGLLFRHRAFCTLLCPAGAVFGLYARVAPYRLGIDDPDICAGCDRAACVEGGGEWRRFALGRGVLYWECRREGCPAELTSERLGENPGCTLCLNCAPNCPKGNVYLGRSPWPEEASRIPLGPSETLFFVVLFGLLTANFSKVFVELRELIFWLPETAARLLGWEAAGFYLLAVPWVALGLPLLLFLPSWLLLKGSGLKSELLPPGASPRGEPPPSSPLDDGPRFWSSLGRLSLSYIPLVLGAHLVLGAVKLNAKGGYLPFVLQDPTGVRSYLAMHVMQTVNQPGVVLPLDLLKWLVLALLVGGYLASLAVARRVACGAERGFFAASALGVTLAASLYLATVVRWLFIR